MIRAGETHGFRAIGDANLVQVDVHLSRHAEFGEGAPGQIAVNEGGKVLSRRSHIVIAALGLAVVAACDRAIQGGSDVAPAPTAVNCADATQLRQRGLDDRRRVAETRSDQERIIGTNRATFFAALATIADLMCRVTLAETDEALKPAFEAARKAEGTRSFYERAVHWGEAGFLASQVVPMLIQELPGQAPWIGRWFGPEGEGYCRG